MCEWSPKSGLKRIDPCIKEFIEVLTHGCKAKFEILACCCGHGKYPMSIIAKSKGQHGRIFDMVSNKDIPRTRRFYKRDAEGQFHIPEAQRK